ncbi:peptidoglycan-binding protein, partial [Streptomyces griseomycini]
MSTPPEPGQPHGGPPLEPVHVLRPRRTDALAELFREFEQERAGGRESVPPPRPPVDGRRFDERRPGVRRTAPVLAVAAAAGPAPRPRRPRRREQAGPGHGHLARTGSGPVTR